MGLVFFMHYLYNYKESKRKGTIIMIYTLTLNPAIDKTVEIDGLELGGVNRIATMRTDAGGKGINVSKVISKLSGKSVALGIIGGSGGDMIENSLKEMGIDTDFVKVKDETRVNLKIIDTKNKVNTDINEPGAPVSADVIEAVEKKLASVIKKGDIAVLAGSVPKGTPADIYGRLVRLCNAHEACAVLDVDGALMAPGLEAKPYLIKPNIDELSRLCGKKLVTPQDAAAPAKELVASGIEKVVVSLGGDGALFVDKNGVYLGHSVDVVVRSTVGAGDSMVAAICLALDRGYSIEELIKLSIATSAANVTCSGTQAADWSVIEPLINQVSWEKL